MNLIKRLFGGGKPDAPKSSPATVEYSGFTITPKPLNEAGGYRLSAIIEKGEQAHHLIRADTIRDLEEAQTASIAKAKQVIDEQGDRMFS